MNNHIVRLVDQSVKKICMFLLPQLRKPGAREVLSLQVKYDPASRLKCTATLIDDIQYSRKSCHDEY